MTEIATTVLLIMGTVTVDGITVMGISTDANEMETVELPENVIKTKKLFIPKQKRTPKRPFFIAF